MGADDAIPNGGVIKLCDPTPAPADGRDAPAHKCAGRNPGYEVSESRQSPVHR